MSAVRKAAAALLAGAALAAAAPAAQAGLPTVFVGLCSDQVWWQQNEFDAGWKVAVQRHAGIDVMRVAFRWADLERSPGVWDYGMADRAVRRLASNGMRALPVLQSPPPFASAAPENPKPGMYPPKSFSEFAAFGVRMLQRYGPGGTFWDANPGVPYLPLRAWQVWNEPNIQPWWASGPNAAEYVRLLRTTAAAMRAVDPDVEIVSAGIPDSSLGIAQDRYLREMYAAGAKGTFDTLGLHAYATEVDGVMGQLGRARDIMGEYKDGSPMWVTEFGWATGGPISPFTTTEAGQAARIGEAVRRIAARRDELKLRGFMLFTWQDVPFGTMWAHYSGLVRADASNKPAYSSFVDAVREIREAAGEPVEPPPPPPPPPPPASEPPPAATAPGEAPAPAEDGSPSPEEAETPAGGQEAPAGATGALPGSPAASSGPLAPDTFRVLRADRGRALREPVLSYFPEPGSTLMAAGTTLPFAVVGGCRRACRVSARYRLEIRRAGGGWAPLAVPAQRFRLRGSRARVLKLVLTARQLRRVRRAPRTRLRATVSTPRRGARSGDRTAVLRLVFAS